MSNSIQESIKELFTTMLSVSPADIRPETTPGDLSDWDSMQHLILVSGFEEEFDIEIEPEEALDMYEDYATFEKILIQKLA